MFVQNLKVKQFLRNLWQKKNIGKKEKWTNKGTDKQYVADLFMHYNLSYQMSVQNFKVLCQVVPEKYLTKISIFITLGFTGSKTGK